jgi:hypothetical protein
MPKTITPSIGTDNSLLVSLIVTQNLAAAQFYFERRGLFPVKVKE